MQGEKYFVLRVPDVTEIEFLECPDKYFLVHFDTEHFLSDMEGPKEQMLNRIVLSADGVVGGAVQPRRVPPHFLWRTAPQAGLVLFVCLFYH